MNFSVYMLMALLGSTSASFFGKILEFIGNRPACTASNGKWDGLRERWGIYPFNNAFKGMPRTVEDALENNFVKAGSCDDNGVFRGIPYVKDNDKTVILLFDVNGIIAGVQTEVPREKLNYGRSSLPKAFVEVGGKYYLTAYFVLPDSICTQGRTRGDLEMTGTGNMLLIQTGNDPKQDYLLVPQKQSDMTQANYFWTDGKCVPTMGHLYWHGISQDMDCDNFFPVFFLYNKGRLNAFGWLLQAKMESPYIIHPFQINYHFFFEKVPKCLYDRGQLAAIHFFLTDKAFCCNMC